MKGIDLKERLKKLKGKFSFGNVKAFFKNKKKRRIFIISVILLAIIAVVLTWFVKNKLTTTKAEAITASVTRGDINNVIEGTGTIEAISQYEISSLAKGDVIADYFEEGDYVKKDQLLYEVDSSSLDKNISKQKSSIEKAKLSYNDAQQNLADLNVKSTIGGVITNLYVSVGDNVSNGTKIAEVIDSDTLKISMPFGADDAKNIYVGEGATVTVSNQSRTLNGVVSSVGTGVYANTYGASVTDVEIKVSNPGAISAGTKATAIIGGYGCYDSGEFEYSGTKTVVAKVNGEVVKINRKKGDRVESGGTIVTLKSTNVERSVNEARMSLDDSNLSLEDLYDSLDDYKIKSPINGKVIQKNIKAGEKMDSNSSAVMAIVADLSTLTFDINIDELDISSISVGQPVTIEADAIENRIFSGKVSNISIVGTAYQGVTSYPVTVTVDGGESSGLIPGMNVSAKIVVQSVNNVLRVPVSAIRMGSYVIVKDDGTFKSAFDSMKEMFDMSKKRNADSMNGKQGNKENDSQNKKDNSASADNDNTDAAADKDKTNGAEADQQQNPQNDRPGYQMNGQGTGGQGFGGQRTGGQQYGGQRPTGQGFGGRSFGGNGSGGQGANSPASGGQGTGGGNPSAASGPRQTSSLFGTMIAEAAEDENSMETRFKNMLDKLDVPEGYVVVMVRTGLSDGSFIEIKETEGGLKEGDIVLLPDVSNSAQSSTIDNMRGGMGMPGGMGGMGMPGGMGGMRSGFSGGASRSGFGGSSGSSRQSGTGNSASRQSTGGFSRMGR